MVGLLITAGVGCTTGKSTGSKRTTTTATTTSAPTPSTVTDAAFDQQATTAELMIRNAGTDPCAVIKAFPLSSSMPTPVNPAQVERGVKVIVALFNAIAASAPPEAAADAPLLKKAAEDLLAEGEANKWQPKWLLSTPKSITGPEVTKAFSDYQSTVMKSCMAQTPTTAKP